MAHIWVRAEQRAFEQRVGLTPSGAKKLISAGHTVTVEESSTRAIPIIGYEDVGCTIAAEHSWMDAPDDAIIFGLKELNEDGPDLKHRHIMFGHAYKGQSEGPALLNRFKRAGGTLYDLEYLVTENGRRIAAFGYWAGFAGAAVGVMTWIAQQKGEKLGPVGVYQSKDDLVFELKAGLVGKVDLPTTIIIGALGRVGTGAGDLSESLGLQTTRWDMAETAHGGPFPEIQEHTLFVNCILAAPDVPQFVPADSISKSRTLSVIADVSCDPSSDYNPIPIYDHSTTFAEPVIRIADTPNLLDVMAIDNLPSMLPVESSEDYAEQLLPSLLEIDAIDQGVWGRAAETFKTHVNKL
ncbi:saccharopine dehydrogenase [Amylibacter sp. SFDW26]|uniref:saccharopine dehydrogenase n=1 Tax=Amylibacter sp. SFDW26 TaxID=2652722 RepID=UPI0012628C1B|nr:saccharopine dehydrogenase [Amylibacter sp. SFDW26]KAB7615781.1 saccharopine dehydrogenase [Amylibacter sp. SFDW26]